MTGIHSDRSGRYTEIVDTKIAIRSVLESLLLQTDDACAFALIEHSDSGKFLQFVGSVSSALLLDLPWQALSEVEFYRAVEFFRQRGIANVEHQLLDAPSGKPVAKQLTFQESFRSVDAATEVAISLFEQVYRLPSGSLKVTVESGA